MKRLLIATALALSSSAYALLLNSQQSNEAPPPPPPPPGSLTNALVGIYRGSNQSSERFSQAIGRDPDASSDSSFMGGVGPSGGSDPHSLCVNGECYPLIGDFDIFDQDSPGCSTQGCTLQAYQDALDGRYDSTWQGIFSDLMRSPPYAPSGGAPGGYPVYIVRINHEWPGDWFVYDPIGTTAGGTIDPATWVAATRRMVLALKAWYPNLKIYFDAPSNDAQQAYWIGDDLVDVTGQDLYFNPQWDGATGQDAWNYYYPNGQLGYTINFAQQHNKPLGFPEWADCYTDSTYAMDHFMNLMTQVNTVFQVYWDSDDATTPTCAMYHMPERYTVYNKYIPPGSSYTGTFFGPPYGALPIPSPANNPY